MKHIPNTSLEIIKDLGNNKIICKCIECGIADEYIKKYAIENSQKCRNCAEYKRLIADGPNEKIMDLIQKTMTGEIVKREGLDFVVMGQSIPGIPLGSQIVLNNQRVIPNNHVHEIICYVGTFGKSGYQKSPDRVAIKCLRCGNVEVLSIKNAIGLAGTTCKVCVSVHKEAMERYNKAMESVPRERGRPKLTEEEIEARRREKKMLREQNQQQSVGSKQQKKQDKDEAALRARLSKLENENPGYYVTSKVENNQITAKLICKTCGSLKTINENSRIRKDMKCKGCIILEKNPFYRGIYARDYTNKVFNFLRITSQYKTDDGYLCDAICEGCKKNFRKLNLIEVIDRKIACDCKRAEIFITCNKCGAPVYVPISKIHQDYNCRSCGNEISRQTLEHEAAIDDVKRSMSIKARTLGSELNYRDTELLTEQSLVREKTALYAGTDDEMYYRCACVEHNIQLILSTTEIDNFDHEQCMDSRQHLLNGLKPESIRLE